MKPRKQPYHMAQLGHLENNEAQKLLKQASKMRKLALATGGRKSSLGDILADLVHAPANDSLSCSPELVTWVGPKTAMVAGHESDLNGHRLAVGDMARVSFLQGIPKVVGVEPRRTKLARPDVDNPHLERVIVANIDAVCIVVSVLVPPLHPRLIDRYLVAIQYGGADAILVVNKSDLLSEEDMAGELEKIAPYASIEIPIFACSANTGHGLEALRQTLKGKTCAFVGHSGVGKSSLANALFPRLELKVGGLMSGHGRGAHTTSSSSLFEVGEGTRLIDTPGIRSFGLGKLGYSELQGAFPEFEGFRCKFRDCRHYHEPQCGVKEAVERGEVFRERYETYLRLLEEVT